MIDFSPLWITLKTGIVAIIFTFFLGILLARLIYNMKNNVLKIIIDGVLTLPLVLPPTVLGFLLLMVFGNSSFLGDLFFQIFNMTITFSWLATVIAAVVVALPLMYRSAKGAFMQINQDDIDAAKTLGMSNRAIFYKIMIPESIYTLVSGGILAFARGLGEFGATSMLAGNIPGKTRTLPLAIYSDVIAGNSSRAGVYVLLTILICLLAVIIINVFEVKTKKRRDL